MLEALPSEGITVARHLSRHWTVNPELKALWKYESIMFSAVFSKVLSPVKVGNLLPEKKDSLLLKI